MGLSRHELMTHINDNRLCTVAFKTTGPIPNFHDLVEIAIVPLNNVSLDRTVLPFNMLIQPQRPHTIKGSLSQQNLTEVLSARPSYDVAALFEKWYKRLGILPRKRLIPIGYNLHKLWPFLIDFHSWSDAGECFAEDFWDFTQARSLNTLTHYWDDLAWWNGEPYPFQKHHETYAAFRLGYVYEEHRTTLSRALMYQQIWQRIVDTPMRSGIPLRINYPKAIDYSVYSKEYEEDDD